ncbi:unnamed protein product [Dibothriocephalus latus]|uniref:Sorting nexin/Vps5-like C-terminal domain-containing protein n=1 Tax=Dibothriocephalus latus TaxID=60516 RepID=A0A3P7N182_DIBLA|nr:unnamed protein product [Dibothriocephalus latus]
MYSECPVTPELNANLGYPTWETLSERVKMYKALKDNESALRGKREQKVRIEMSPKADRAKIPTLEREISEVHNFL